MAKNDTAKQEELLELVYPVYLNVPMLTSFIAALEDGVAFEADRSSSTQVGTDKKRLLDGAAKIGGAFSGLLGFDMKGQISNGYSSSDQETIKVLRKHTEASLFMRFRETLSQNNLIHSVDYLEDAQIETIQKGSFIEISGILRKNFLEVTVGTIEQLKPYMEMSTNKAKPALQPRINNRQRNQGNSGNIQKEKPTNFFESTEWKMLETIRSDISKSDIQDLLFKSSCRYKGKSINLIVPLLKSQLEDINFEGVRFSEITLFGKIISMNLGDKYKTNLLRRATFSNIPEEVIMELLKAGDEMMKQLNPKTEDLSSPFVEIAFVRSITDCPFCVKAV